MLYILREQYKPNKAETNRLLAYLHGFDEQGVKATVVFFIPDKDCSEVTDTFINIDFVYWWKKYNIQNRYLKHIIEHLYLRQFICTLREGDTVFLSGYEFAIKNLVRRKGIRVYFETTEKPGLCRQFGWYSDIQTKLYFRACKYLDGISVISTAIKDDFIKLGVPPEKIHIINMTVESSRFEGLEKQQCEKYIAYCGTATNNKDGVDQLIKAFAIFYKKHSDYKLYIIGETPSKSMAFSNLELVRSLGVENSVVFTGIVSAKDIPQMLKNAQILALDRPDNIQAKYGFPTKLGEYLLTENPVVVTRVGDIPRFLTDKENALLAKPDDPEDFAKQMDWVVDNSDESLRIGRNGAQIAMNCFNSKIETGKLYNMIIES